MFVRYRWLIDYVNHNIDELTSEQLIDQEIIPLLNNQPGKSEEVDNNKEEDTLDEDLSNSSVFNIVKILSN